MKNPIFLKIRLPKVLYFKTLPEQHSGDFKLWKAWEGFNFTD